MTHLHLFDTQKTLFSIAKNVFHMTKHKDKSSTATFIYIIISQIKTNVYLNLITFLKIIEVFKEGAQFIIYYEFFYVSTSTLIQP